MMRAEVDVAGHGAAEPGAGTALHWTIEALR